jgi:hypothetical protein
MSDYFDLIDLPSETTKESRESFSGLDALIEKLSKRIKIKKYKSIPYVFSGLTIDGKQTIADLDYGGAISEILILAPTGTTGFSAKVITDGQPIYDDSYTNFETYSDYFTDLTAIDDGTYTMLLFNNVFFEKSCKVEIRTTTEITFTRIWVKAIKQIIG